jgi:hypothetical protein
MSKEKNKTKKETDKKNKDTAGKSFQADKHGVAGSPENFRVVFSWETVDLIKNPASDLYLAVAVIASMGMVAWGIYSRSFTVVVTFIMLAVVIILALNEEPKRVKVKISESGIDLNGAHYNFDEFKSFSISYSSFYGAGAAGSQSDGLKGNKKDLPVLNLNPKKPYLPARTIYIENEPEEDMEEFLEIYLSKEEKKV